MAKVEGCLDSWSTELTDRMDTLRSSMEDSRGEMQANPPLERLT